jgi:hypothetical protein
MGAAPAQDHVDLARLHQDEHLQKLRAVGPLPAGVDDLASLWGLGGPVVSRVHEFAQDLPAVALAEID